MYEDNKKNTLGNFLLFGFISILTFVILIVKIFDLQVLKGNEYFILTRKTILETKAIKPLRGLIYDRNGIKLVENEIKFDIYLPIKNVNERELYLTIDNLSKILNKDIIQTYNANKNIYEKYDFIEYVLVEKALNYHPYIFSIESKPSNFPSVKIEQYYNRKYLYPEITSHILGYLGEVTKEDIESGIYKYSDKIGKDGIEKTLDLKLRGKEGISQKIINNKGEIENHILKPAVNGEDTYLSIDINIQKKLYDLIEKTNKRPELQGAISYGIVVQDVTNGEIIALASYPSYDSNKMTNNISITEYEEYIKNPGKPLLNKVTQYSQPPGSTFKVITQLVSLQNEVANKNTKYYTGGTFTYGDVTFRDFNNRNFGEIDMIEALCKSSNIYHMKLVLELDKKTQGNAASKIYELFDSIGLNASSGIGIGTESIGYFPTPENKLTQGKIWRPGDLLNASIGQGDVKLTVVESAKMVSTIASDGLDIPQTIFKDGNSGKKFKSLNIKKEHFNVIKEGMKCATLYNNPALGIKENNSYPQIAIKTGSAETGEIINGNQKVQAWEISFAPIDNPKYAMSIFIENATHGWKAGFISRELYKELIK